MAKGLREKHRRKRTEQVLDAADTLFRDKGYEETKIEEIAELASVASATVYNYFKNKPNLLMEIALRHIRAAVPERRKFIANLPDDAMAGIIEYEKLLADQAVRHLTPECWRVVMSAQFVDADGVAHRTAKRLDRIIRRQYASLLGEYQRSGKIRADVDTNILCDILICLGNAALARLITTPSMNVEMMREINLPHLRLLLSGVITSPHN